MVAGFVFNATRSIQRIVGCQFGLPLVYVALAVGAARADTMVCTIDASVTHCEASLRHYRATGTREGNRTYYEDNKGRHWMMIEENGRTTIIPH
jgi:hypothetical protein